MTASLVHHTVQANGIKQHYVEAVRGALNDYRAGREDVAQDKEDAETKITCPTLPLWDRISNSAAGCGTSRQSGER